MTSLSKSQPQVGELRTWLIRGTDLASSEEKVFIIVSTEHRKDYCRLYDVQGLFLMNTYYITTNSKVIQSTDT